MNRGEIWGRYAILQYLGSGAMGEVYLALNQENGMQVAVKRVRRGAGTEGEEKIAAERLGAELEKQLGAIDTRVTKVFWYGDIGADLAIEMEYIDGQDLSALTSQGPLPPGRAAVIAAELCEMLRNLRGFSTEIAGRMLTGVIHGDLKPKNIRIDSHDRIKVMDFGVAKALSRARDYTASLFGSIAYCSPERLDSGSMDSQSDLWSVGVMLYQMISGRLPFEGSTPERLECRIRDAQPPEPLPAACPEPLRRITFKMLARNLTERYATETDAREDIERFLRGESVLAPPVPAPDATVRTADTDDLTRRTAPPLPPPPPQRKSVRVALRREALAGLAALLALGLLAIWLLRPQYQAWAATRQLKYDIEAEHLNATDAWNAYQKIISRGPLPIATWGISSPLKARLTSEGDQPILDFRNNDFLTSREAQWRRSIVAFSHALELDSSDRSVKGRLRLCEGHLQRITADGPSKQEMLNEAARKFQEAAQLMPSSPDPYLGLERLYAYSDPDRAQEAMDKAHEYGHTATRRELAQMADGYFTRASQTVLDSEKLQGNPENEREYLFRARRDFEQARELYSRVGSYGKAAKNLIGATRALDRVQTRLQEMDILPSYDPAPDPLRKKKGFLHKLLDAIK